MDLINNCSPKFAKVEYAIDEIGALGRHLGCFFILLSSYWKSGCSYVTVLFVMLLVLWIFFLELFLKKKFILRFNSVPNFIEEEGFRFEKCNGATLYAF